MERPSAGAVGAGGLSVGPRLCERAPNAGGSRRWRHCRARAEQVEQKQVAELEAEKETPRKAVAYFAQKMGR